MKNSYAKEFRITIFFGTYKMSIKTMALGIRDAIERAERNYNGRVIEVKEMNVRFQKASEDEKAG